MKRRCRKCGAAFEVRDESSKRTLCSNCRPVRSGATGESNKPAGPGKGRSSGRKQSPGRRSSKAGGNKSLPMLASVAGGITLVLCVVIFLAFRGPEDAPAEGPEMANTPAAVPVTDDDTSPSLEQVASTPQRTTPSSEIELPSAARTTMEAAADPSGVPTATPSPQSASTVASSPPSASTRKPADANTIEVTSDPDLDPLEQIMDRALTEAAEYGKQKDREQTFAALVQFADAIEKWHELILRRRDVLRLSARAVILPDPPVDVASLNDAEFQELEKRVQQQERQRDDQLMKALSNPELSQDEALALAEGHVAPYRESWTILCDVGRDWGVRIRRIERFLQRYKSLPRGGHGAVRVQAFQDKFPSLLAPRLAPSRPVGTISLHQVSADGGRHSRRFHFGRTSQREFELFHANWIQDKGDKAYLLGSSALSLLSGRGDTTTVAGLTVLLNSPIAKTNSLTLSAMEMDADAWTMIAAFDALRVLTFEHVRHQGDAPGDLSLSELEELTLSHSRLPAPVMAALIQSTRPARINIFDLNVEGRGTLDTGFERTTNLVLASGTGVDQVWEAVVEANVLTELSIDPACLPLESWQQVGRLSQLQKVSLRGGPLDDEHLQALAGCPALKELFVAASLTATTERAFAKLTQLKNVHLIGSGPDFSLQGLTSQHQWESLRLNGSFVFDDGLLRQIGQLSALRSLWLDKDPIDAQGNRMSEDQAQPAASISANGLAAINRLASLKSVHMRPTMLADRDLQVLQKHPSLASFAAPGSRVTPAGVFALVDSWPSIQNRQDRRAALLQSSGIWAPQLQYWNLGPFAPFPDNPLRDALRSLSQNQNVGIYWLPGTPRDANVVVDEGLTFRGVLDAIAASAKCDWESDGHVIYFGTPQAIERVSRRLDNQLAIYARCREDEKLKWLVDNPGGIRTSNQTLAEVVNFLIQTQSLPENAIILDPREGSLNIRRVTLNWETSSSQIQLLDGLTLLNGLKWEINRDGQIVIRTDRTQQ